MSENMKMQVSLVENGKQAIDKLIMAIDSNEPYDLILIDWKMPNLDGIQTVQKLYQQCSSVPPSVIMVTAYGKDAAAKEAKQLNVAIPQILTKPVTASSFLDAVMNALDLSNTIGTTKQSNKNQLQANIKQLFDAKILLVEDNSLNQEVAKELLSNNHILVTIANNGQEAVELVRNENFDAVLMDIQMPVMDGYAATRKIREFDSELVIIAMTANAMASDQELAFSAGMNDYISKPINVSDMFSTIRKWVELEKKEPHSHHVKEIKSVDNEISVNSSQQLFLKLKYIDYENALFRLDNDTALYLQILKIFSTDHANDLEKITNFLDAGDFDSAIRCAHTLKGVAGNVGADSVFHITKKLESCIKNCQETEITEQEILTPSVMEICADQISGTKKLLSQTLIEIRTLIEEKQKKPQSNIDTPAGIAVDDKELFDKLSDLLVPLESYNTVSEQIVDSISELNIKPEIKKQLLSIKKQITDYDFESATEAVKELMDKLPSYK